MSKLFFADLHCHPTLKPFGKSTNNGAPRYPDEKTSLWYKDKPTLADKALDLIGLTRYTQSDFTSAIEGNVNLSFVSYYVPEVSFFMNKLGDNTAAKLIENFITQFGLKRITEIESKTYDYFSDLKEQYEYLKDLNGKNISHEGKCYKYIMAKNYADLQNILKEDISTTIIVIPNIEGGHSLGCGQDVENKSTPESLILDNIKTVKNWEHKPFYITLAHHFYNELCGHTKSLPSPVNKILDQNYGMGTGFTDKGLKAVHSLLDNSENKRILIDIKHLSIKSRTEYFNLLKSDYSSENIPILHSHGAVNGLESFSDAGKTIDGSLFNEWSIGVFNEEIVTIAKSKGLIGLNLDQRILGSKLVNKKAGKNLTKKKMLLNWSELLWNNIQHIGEQCNKNGLPAWDTICLGSDYDGIINPINGYYTQKRFPELKENLIIHANNYMKSNKTSSSIKIDAEELVEKIMIQNTMEFLKNNF